MEPRHLLLLSFVLILNQSSLLIQACTPCTLHLGTYGPKDCHTSPYPGANKWMKLVSDNMKLSELTIPGTHDSGSIIGHCSDVVRYENWGLDGFVFLF